jgi:hypothetical protein
MVGYAGGGYMKPKKYQDGGQAFPEMALRRAEPMDLSPGSQKYIRLGLTSRGDPLYQDKRDLENAYFTGAAESYDIVDYPERKAYKKFIQEGKGNARDDMYLRRFSKLRNELQRNFDKDLVGLDNLNFLAEKGYSIDEKDRKAPLDRAMRSRDKIDDTLLSMYVSDSFKPAMREAGISGYQEGGAVQDDAMMEQFLQQQQMMQQPQQGGNGFVPFDQRQPGAAASGSWGEPGAYMESLRASRDSLQQAAEQAKLDSARQSLEAIKLDSLIRSLGKEGESIERRPEGGGYLFNDLPSGRGFMKEGEDRGWI